MTGIVLTTKEAKLADVCRIEGYDLDQLLALTIVQGTCKGICTNVGCDYTNDVEGDQRRGWCEPCETNSVKSALVLASMI